MVVEPKVEVEEVKPVEAAPVAGAATPAGTEVKKEVGKK
jgi:hypothetical protein